MTRWRYPIKRCTCGSVLLSDKCVPCMLQGRGEGVAAVGTRYAEADAIVAALQRDDERLEELLSDFDDEERAALDAACRRIIEYRTKGQLFADRWKPHARGCGIHPHEHGPSCSRDCPTCHGPRSTWVSDEDLAQAMDPEGRDFG